jgi:type I site-specific restriction-modification system R (restriction) subunit
MTPDEPRLSGARERRGLDPAILQFLHTLLEDYAEAHRREHVIQQKATEDAIDLAAERLEELGSRITEHFNTLLTERDNKYSERFISSQTALEAAAKAAQEAIRQALLSAKEETTKTEQNWVKQADAQYVKVEQLGAAISKVVPREESETNKKEIDRRLSEMDRRMTVVESAKVSRVEQRTEIQQMVPWILAAISLAGLILAILTRVTVKP